MKRLIACLLATLPYIGAVAHVWDELAILARRNGDGTFTLEKDSYLAVSTYTNAVFFDYNNDGNLDLLIIGQGLVGVIHGIFITGCHEAGTE